MDELGDPLDGCKLRRATVGSGATQTFGPVTMTKGLISRSSTSSMVKSNSFTFNVASGDTAEADTILADNTTPAPMTKSGAGTAILDGSNTYTGATVVNAGTLQVNRSSRTSSSLTINNGRMVMKSNGSNVLQVGSLSVSSTATLDLNDNDLVVNSGAFSDVQSLVFAGYRTSADPSATGIVSTTGQTAVGNPILALFDNSLVGAADFPFGSGQTIPANAIVGKYTYLGDTDMNGQVTPDDYGAVDSNLGQTGLNLGIAWFMGDTDFNGDITPDDYGAIDANLGNGAGNPLAANGAAAVPEPASLTAIGLAGGLLMTRRRRRSGAPASVVS